MTWTRRTQPIQVGDLVRYSAEWLRSTCQYAGDIAHAKGRVTALQVLSPEVVLATIDWGNTDIPERVNVRNLQRVRERGV